MPESYLEDRTPSRNSPDLSADLLTRAAQLEPLPPSSNRLLLREEIYDRIRVWIVEGHLPPGTRVRDKDIAETLNVSRTPVREAMRRLEDEGLIVAEASRWTKVAPVDIGEAERIYPIVWTLERLAVSMTGHWSGERLRGLREANGRLAAALAVKDAPAASRADTDFHSRILEATANPELIAIIRDLKTRLRRIEITYFHGSTTMEPSVAEHERIIAALEAGDLEAAGEEIEHNWRASFARLRERRAEGTGSL
ncbi:GntR family transcriptional regulator [Thermoactinospora rubra]|uniref:GntR family transcriptional regulator n=1 Tax=Thermoactinospora rubra TaxID=1088767 RepID=UPI000A0F9FF9|nr:GntR family transcriptional regulator [Thermoactinospora rubra]